MQTLSLSVNPSDLPYTLGAVQSIAEQILGRTHLAPDRLKAMGGGLLINQHSSCRPWHFPADKTIQHGYLIDQIEFEEQFGIHLLANQAVADIPARRYLLICSCLNVPQAAEFLRSEILGPTLALAYGPRVLSVAISECLAALGIPERPVNDARLPSYSKTRLGALLRLDAASAKVARKYFSLDESCTLRQPIAMGLGAESFLVWAESGQAEEPLRIMLSAQWNVSVVTKELNRWLKSLNKSTRKGIIP